MSVLKLRKGKPPVNEVDDPVIQMLGVGQDAWEDEPGDGFVARLRSEEPAESPIHSRPIGGPGDLVEAVWSRIIKNQGEQFQTRKGLPVTYKVDGNGIWFFRGGERINRKVTRSQVEVAISRCPLKSTTEIKDLMDYPYLFAVLMDPRIRAQAW